MLFNYWDRPEILIYWFMIFAFSISVHESAHAYVAYRFGDPTAKDLGRITLDPLKHFDVFGTIMILISFIGWAKPVPVNPRNFKNHKYGTMFVSLAGPVSNLILAVVFAIPFVFLSLKSFPPSDNAIDPVEIMFNLSYFGVVMNTGLAIFNLLPIPPLDGSKILTGILPAKYYFKIMEYHQISFVILIVLAYTGWLSRILIPAREGVMGAIFFVIEPLVRVFV